MTTEPDRPIIRVSAALIVDDRGRMLLVRKRGTTVFMNPGGKPEAGETAAGALARELHEELGLVLNADEFEYLGRFDTDAANEAGHGLDAELFRVAVAAPARVGAEIEELVWLHPTDLTGRQVAPLVRQHALKFV